MNAPATFTDITAHLDAIASAQNAEISAIGRVLARGYRLASRGHDYREEDAETLETLAEDLRDAADALAASWFALADEITNGGSR